MLIREVYVKAIYTLLKIYLLLDKQFVLLIVYVNSVNKEAISTY